MFRLALLLLCLIFTPSAHAADLAGTWDMVADGRVISRLELRHTTAGWSGVWMRPTSFDFDGNTFTKVEGPIVRRSSISGRSLPIGIAISFPDPRPNSSPDMFHISPLDNNRALLDYVGLNYEPITLIRGGQDALGPWNKNGRYTRTVHRTDDPDLEKIVEEDQADRENERLNLAELAAADERRREAVRRLVEVGALSSEQDFYRAALIFQHGNSPRDYLWAHTLATVAAARGNANANWLAAASLDRYLQAIGRPQVFGTQRALTTKMPAPKYDPSAVPDSLRRAMRVPVLSEQDPRITQQAR